MSLSPFHKPRLLTGLIDSMIEMQRKRKCWLALKSIAPGYVGKLRRIRQRTFLSSWKSALVSL